MPNYFDRAPSFLLQKERKIISTAYYYLTDTNLFRKKSAQFSFFFKQQQPEEGEGEREKARTSNMIKSDIFCCITFFYHK